MVVVLLVLLQIVRVCLVGHGALCERSYLVWLILLMQILFALEIQGLAHGLFIDGFDLIVAHAHFVE